MPDDRSTTEAIAALTQGLAEFRKCQTERKISNTASFARIMEMMEEMRAEMRSEIRQLKVHETRAEKQPIHQSTPSFTPASHSTDYTLSSPPLVPTPSDIGECGDIKGSIVDAMHDSKPNTVTSYNVSRPIAMKIIVGMTYTLDRQVKVSANSSFVHSLATQKLRNIGLENSYGVKRLQISGYSIKKISGYELNSSELSCPPTVCENASMYWPFVIVDARFLKPPGKPPDGVVLGKVDVRKEYELPQICAAFGGERRGSKMSLSGAGKVVCVTGAAGYIAFGIVKLLLQRGYTVKASARDPNDWKKTQHLTALDGAKERLQLYKANLLEKGSFDPIVEGCEGVFHTASPFYHTMVDPHAELIDSVKRVILTSSIAAVAYNGKPRTPEVVVDETWFSNPDVCKEMKLWYVISKTLAEEAAWEFVKEKGIDMVTINPAMVIGPLLQPTLNTSAAAILNLINGSETYPNASFGRVKVKDVAEAHILAFEGPSANGRYCLVERVIHSSEVVNMLHKLYPDIKLPTKCANDKLMEQLIAGADSTRLGIIWISNKFGIFSSSRPPEVANLEDKVLSEGGSIVTHEGLHDKAGKGARQRMASPKIPLTRIGYESAQRGGEGRQGVTWTNRLAV